jgi:predicted RNA-binding protein YlqC (UPF0109 family)
MLLQLSEIVRSLVHEYIEDPETLIIEEENGDNTCLIRVKAGRGDTAKIIGKAGRNINALRTLVNAIASKRKVRVNLHVVN